jgi:F-type H+-transporting ATPase subunit beta
MLYFQQCLLYQGPFHQLLLPTSSLPRNN